MKWSDCSLITTKWVSQFSKTGQLTEEIFIGKWGLFHSSSGWAGVHLFLTLGFVPLGENPGTSSLFPSVLLFVLSSLSTWHGLFSTIDLEEVVPFCLFGNQTAHVLGIMQLCLASFKESATREGSWGFLSRLSGPANDVWNARGESFQIQKLLRKPIGKGCKTQCLQLNFSK